MVGAVGTGQANGGHPSLNHNFSKLSCGDVGEKDGPEFRNDQRELGMHAFVCSCRGAREWVEFTPQFGF